MSNARRGGATSDGSRDSREAFLLEVDRAVSELRSAIRALRNGRDEVAGSRTLLVPGGTILITDDGRGIARAVAADLKALGHPVLRVRHGLGDAPIEGINFSSAAAVAALIERARGQGNLAAIIHCSPLTADAGRPGSWDQPDNVRALALLAQIAGDDLVTAAGRGGSCLIVAQFHDAEDQALQAERLGRWMEISERSLKGVRVRPLTFRIGAEDEVVAAEIVRAVLGSDRPAPIAGQIGSRHESNLAMLLGAPDRASWLHLAAALVDWLEDFPRVRLSDLACTLHQRQPAFPFRVGLVAESGPDLSSRLARAITKLSDPNCGPIHDLDGAYWFPTSDPAAMTPRRKSPGIVGGHHRLREIPYRVPVATPTVTVASLLERSGRQWLSHRIAVEFARHGRMPASLLDDPEAEPVDLSLPFPPRQEPGVRPAESRQASGSRRILTAALDALDSVLDLRRGIVTELCDF